jgi:hypothetical protein
MAPHHRHFVVKGSDNMPMVSNIVNQYMSVLTSNALE